ncbi:Uncharacterised protein [Serratia entomophila]|nr:Uncharacterised protein [Serratia entomophila]CAI1049048.1 Uncharacterised protein [Serratia entomophila]CAI1056998.1 Uncharacterised protein [Serratia entomophila]CAI1057766.1 Uncharacterised protein [Serratia entomophila]CAI1060984.1 Uncharacterised protein [Serratia entomophila]
MLFLRPLVVLLPLLVLHPAPSLGASYAYDAKIYPTDVGYGATATFGWPSPEQPDRPLPCSNPIGGCWLGPAVTLTVNGEAALSRPDVAKMTVKYANRELLSSVRSRWIAKHGLVGTLDEPGWASRGDEPYFGTARACFQYWPDYRNGTYTKAVNLPDTACSTPTPPDVKCDGLPSMVYDFGTVAAGRTDSLRIRQRHILSCTNATSVTFKLQSDLVLSRSLTAHIDVNNQRIGPGGVTLPVHGNSVPLDFVVTTTGTENTGGSYNASSVLIMEYK